ncbi:MAG: hypothetical protein Q9225_004773 [Loekoesia sp. 1 TL-2023]
MAPRSPSIQSFFKPEIMDSPQPATVPAAAGGGFTSAEVQGTIHPKLHVWQPRGYYEDVQIGHLVPGSEPICVLGRVTNCYDPPTLSRMPHAAKGCLKVLIRDDTGIMMIRLWYAEVDYQLRLGQLVSLWTSHVSIVESAGGGPSTLHTPTFVTSIFPERDNGCCFMTQADKDQGTLFKRPLSYSSGRELTGLITLKNFIEGGHEIGNGKVLVCVKSIGGRKKGVTRTFFTRPSHEKLTHRV